MGGMATAMKYCPACNEVTAHNSEDPPKVPGGSAPLLTWVCSVCKTDNGPM